jgi:hypothetical protein
MFVELLKPFLGKPAGERLHAGDEEAQQLVAAGVARTVADDAITPLISRGLESALSGFTRGLDTIITRTLEQFAQAQGQARKHGIPAIFGPGGEGDPKKTFGDFCLAVARNDRVYLEKHYGSTFNAWQTKAALGESSGVTGGYTVPPEFYQQLMTLIAENSFIRPRAFVLPMASATLQLPYLDVTTVQSAGVSPFFGGVQMYWTAEAQQRTETEPQFKQSVAVAPARSRLPSVLQRRRPPPGPRERQRHRVHRPARPGQVNAGGPKGAVSVQGRGRPCCPAWTANRVRSSGAPRRLTNEEPGNRLPGGQIRPADHGAASDL